MARLRDRAIEPFLIASTFAGGIAQRLVRRICEACRVAVATPPGVAEALAAEGIFEVAVGDGAGMCAMPQHRSRAAGFV